MRQGDTPFNSGQHVGRLVNIFNNIALIFQVIINSKTRKLISVLTGNSFLDTAYSSASM
jgi:hypothetical protein